MGFAVQHHALELFDFLKAVSHVLLHFCIPDHVSPHRSSNLSGQIGFLQCWQGIWLFCTGDHHILCWKGEKKGWYVTSMLTCYDCLSKEMLLVMLTILAGVRSRVTWLNGKTHLNVNASSCTQAGGLCTYITPTSEVKTTTQSWREQILPYSLLQLWMCVHDQGDHVPLKDLLFPVFPVLLFWDICIVGWPWLDASMHKSLSVTSLHIWTGERKCNQGFLGWDKDWERALIKNLHEQNRLKFGILIEFITNKIKAG